MKLNQQAWVPIPVQPVVLQSTQLTILPPCGQQTGNLDVTLAVCPEVMVYYLPQADVKDMTPTLEDKNPSVILKLGCKELPRQES